MKKIISLALMMFSLTAYSQVVDSAPNGNKNFLPVEGGIIRMKIDTKSPLPELINKLNSDWVFIETGKAYWIGYTTDMFSIASRGDKAIPELIKFFKTTKSKKGKIGAIYVLHLIGIDGQIVGRFSEDFKNENARNALLGLLSDKEYAYTIMTLLRRDPWNSDIPKLFEAIKNENDTEILWPIINSLDLCQINALPISNKIPENISKLTITLNVKNENSLEKDFDFNAQIKEALKIFDHTFSDIVKVEHKLYNEELSPYFQTKLASNLRLGSFIRSLDIDQPNGFGYDSIGCKLQYYVENNTLYFITIKTAQQRLIGWWNTLSNEEKEKFR